MKPWAAEYGTFWVWDKSIGLPPICPARVKVEFEELGYNDIETLTTAMDLPNPDPIQQRFERNRRCFSLKLGGEIAAYGWVTHGVELVGELERPFHLRENEAYIWDCVTVPTWRGNRLYSALLSQIIYKLQDEGVPRIWIGASRLNKPSIQGFVNAGFEHVMDLNYWRFYRLTILGFQEAPTAKPQLKSAAYRILVNKHERRIGQFAIGFERNKE